MASISTSLSLILRVRDQDKHAWTRMNGIYGPLVYRWCRRRGIDANDAADIMQDVLVAVAKNIHGFELGKKDRTFLGWLYGITSFKIADHFRSRLGRHEVAIEGIENTLVDGIDDSSEVMVSEDDRRLVVHRAIAAFREDISEIYWKAFWRTTVDGLKAPEVADELGISADAVRQNKHRVMKKLREELKHLEQWDEPS